MLGLFPAIRLSQFPMNTNLSFRCPIEFVGSVSEKIPLTNDKSEVYNPYQYVLIIGTRMEIFLGMLEVFL